MTQPEPADLRISDAERESAMTALGEHMSAGRLNIDEYGERSAQVTAAKTRGELSGLFADLPQPHPALGGQPVPSTAAPVPSDAAPVTRPQPPSPVKQRVMAAAVPLAAIIAAVLFFGLGLSWVVWLLPGAVVLFGGVIFGNDWNDHRGRQHEMHRERHDMRRELERERHDRRREYRDRRRESRW